MAKKTISIISNKTLVTGIFVGLVLIILYFSRDQKIVQNNSVIPSSTPVGITQDQLLNWNTYKNEKYGISFMYPPDWKLEEEISKENNRDIYITAYPQDATRGVEIPLLSMIIWQGQPTGAELTAIDGKRAFRNVGVAFVKNSLSETMFIVQSDIKVEYNSNFVLGIQFNHELIKTEGLFNKDEFKNAEKLNAARTKLNNEFIAARKPPQNKEILDAITSTMKIKAQPLPVINATYER